jgi:hypothetical protein
MPSVTTYPPPPSTARPKDTTPPTSNTLYDTSPYVKRDKLLRKRNQTSTYTDPLHVVVVILLLSLLLSWKPNLIPFSSSLGITSPTRKSSSPQSNKGNSCNCNHPASHSESSASMVWQKTFTLPSSSRGCHLVTSVVEKEISQGLKGCKVSSALHGGGSSYLSTMYSDTHTHIHTLTHSFPFLHFPNTPGRHIDTLYSAHLGCADHQRELRSDRAKGHGHGHG